jgi:hypothetical protein
VLSCIADTDANFLPTLQRPACCCAFTESYIDAWCTLPNSQVGAGVHVLDCSALSGSAQAHHIEWACQGLNGVSLWTATKSQVNSGYTARSSKPHALVSSINCVALHLRVRDLELVASAARKTVVLSCTANVQHVTQYAMIECCIALHNASRANATLNIVHCNRASGRRHSVQLCTEAITSELRALSQ